MAKHAQPTIVRLWLNGYAHGTVSADVTDWDHGTFTLEPDHPMAIEIRSMTAGYEETPYLAWPLFTVASTDELEWELNRWSLARIPASSPMQIVLRPRQETLREFLASIDYLIAKGLAS